MGIVFILGMGGVRVQIPPNWLVGGVMCITLTVFVFSAVVSVIPISQQLNTRKLPVLQK